MLQINIAPLKKEWKKVAPKITLGKPFKMVGAFRLDLVR